MVRLTSLLLWAFVFLSLSCSYEFLPHSMRSLFVLSMILISTVAHYGCVESNTLFHRLFFPGPVDNISEETGSLTVNGLALMKFSWRNPSTKDFKETTLSWTRANGGPGSETPRQGAPGSSDEITLRLEPDEYTFTLTAVDTQGDTSRPWTSSLIYVGPPCHPNNPDISTFRDTDFSSGFNLSALTPPNPDNTDGFRSLGAAASDLLGQSISSGDINGDGIDDVIIGTIEVDINSGTNTREGAGYVIFGRQKPDTFNNIMLADAPPFGLGGIPDTGFRILGAASSQLGRSVSSGDINGDGIDDVLIAANYADAVSTMPNTNEGAGYVIFGRKSGLTNMTLPPSSADGFRILGAASQDYIGQSISSGDINGDGIDDVLIGASNVDIDPGNLEAGAGYVIFGKESGFMNMILPPNSGDGFTITGAAASDFVGVSISSGDINGDGIDDVLIGANRVDIDPGNLDAGAGYVIFGGNDSNISLSSLPSDRGFRILGATADDEVGSSISSGDINGDGIDDVIIGATEGGISDEGAGYVIFGGNDSNISLSSLPSDRGFRILGAAADDRAGGSISSGDFNGDGIDDVLIGASRVDAVSTMPNTNEGAGYVVFGGNDSNINLSSLTADRGFRILGADVGDSAGRSISSGDINDDGIDDVLIGVDGADVGITNTREGAGYTVLGACQPSSP